MRGRPQCGIAEEIRRHVARLHGVGVPGGCQLSLERGGGIGRRGRLRGAGCRMHGFLAGKTRVGFLCAVFVADLASVVLRGLLHGLRERNGAALAGILSGYARCAQGRDGRRIAVGCCFRSGVFCGGRFRPGGHHRRLEYVRTDRQTEQGVRCDRGGLCCLRLAFLVMVTPGFLARPGRLRGIGLAFGRPARACSGRVRFRVGMAAVLGRVAFAGLGDLAGQ